MHRIEVDHRSIFYRDEGDGPAVVLLHGFLCDSRAWGPQLSDLSKGFRVVAWDAAGAGASDDPPETFTIADWAEDLARLLDALALEEAHIVGLSWGGLVAQAFYGRYPSRVRSLVLSDTYAGWMGSLPADAVEKRLARCLSESELTPAELVARWVPMEFFTETVVGRGDVGDGGHRLRLPSTGLPSDGEIARRERHHIAAADDPCADAPPVG
jgi:pimeloyl-ACP methyl ester carboxylesterase